MIADAEGGGICCREQVGRTCSFQGQPAGRDTTRSVALSAGKLQKQTHLGWAVSRTGEAEAKAGPQSWEVEQPFWSPAAGALLPTVPPHHMCVWLSTSYHLPHCTPGELSC